jgi:DNA-directed RNA polymerase subunit beta'
MKMEFQARVSIFQVLKKLLWHTNWDTFIFNEAIPQDLGYVDRSNPETAFDLEINDLVDKSKLGKILDRAYRLHGPTKTAETLDKIKELGFRYSTKAAITVSVSDMVIPKEKEKLLKEADEMVSKIESQFRRGLISEEERYESIIKTWNMTTEKVTEALMASLDKFNPIFMMAHSGARGSKNQTRQLAGMRGLMADPSGRIIELPIRSNFREGLNVLEFFISTHGARKGLADTALRTADSGYLTRRLVDVSQDVIVREEDCGTDEGIYVEEIREGNEIIERLTDRIIGRIAAEDVVDNEGNIIVRRNELINEVEAEKIEKAGITKVKIRSLLTCRSRHGVCRMCYGRDLATGELVNIGEAVGIIAAQAIGEPGTQLTMRTFHTGGVAGFDITQGLPRVEELFEARKPKGLAVISEISGVVRINESKKRREVIVTDEENNISKTYLIPYGSRLKVHDGQVIQAGDELTEGSVNPHDLLKIKGIFAVQTYLLQEVQKVYRLQGVEINDKHIEVIIRQILESL